jgi:hypothetical protein
MTQFKKISELDLVTTISDTDLFIVETTNGTKSVKIETFKQNDVTKEDVGLGNCDNTSDLDKPVSLATQDALDLKADTATVEQQIEAINTTIGETITEEINTINESLELKANIDTVNEALGLKANIADVEATYATKEEFNTALSDIETLLQGV